MNIVAVSLIVSRATCFIIHICGMCRDLAFYLPQMISVESVISMKWRGTETKSDIEQARYYLAITSCRWFARFYDFSLFDKPHEVFIEYSRGSLLDNKIIDNHYRRSAQRKKSEDPRKWRNKLSWDWQFKDKFLPRCY